MPIFCATGHTGLYDDGLSRHSIPATPVFNAGLYCNANNQLLTINDSFTVDQVQDGLFLGLSLVAARRLTLASDCGALIRPAASCNATYPVKPVLVVSKRS